jgi:plasmid maintenance system antidote protein VapI
MTDFYANPRIAWRLRELLAEADLTEQEAARKLGVSEATLCRYRDGQESVPRDVILALERLVDMRRNR